MQPAETDSHRADKTWASLVTADAACQRLIFGLKWGGGPFNCVRVCVCEVVCTRLYLPSCCLCGRHAFIAWADGWMDALMNEWFGLASLSPSSMLSDVCLLVLW